MKRTIRVGGALGLGLGAMMLIYLTLGLTMIGLSIYGMVLAFSASIVLGVVVLLIEPLPLIIGLVKLLTGINLAQKILELFTN